jgi:ATP-dependent protease Clp ATPase subunit
VFLHVKPFSFYRPFCFFDTKELLDNVLIESERFAPLMQKHYGIDVEKIASIYELPLYKEYLSKFDTEDIDIMLPYSIEDDFDLLFKLTFASFSSSWRFTPVPDSYEVRLAIDVHSGDRSVRKYLDELLFFQTARMYEIYLKEQIELETLRLEDDEEMKIVHAQRQKRLEYFYKRKEAYEAHWIKTLLHNPHTFIQRNETMENLFLFQHRIWSRLNEKERSEILKRFGLEAQKNTAEDISHLFKDNIVPKAFVIAANAKAGTAFDAELIVTAPYKPEWDRLITFDEDKFGVRRRLRKAQVLLDTPHLRKDYAAYLEQLLQSSLRLKKEEKIAWIRALKQGKPSEALCQMLEEEMKLYEGYFFNDESIKEIKKRIKNARKVWNEIKRAFKENLMPDDSPQGIFQTVTRSVIGQDEAARRIATTLFLQKRLAQAYLNGKKLPFNKVDSVFISGQTGTGKSLLLQTACEAAQLPFVTVNAAGMVSNGIRGYSIDTMFKDIIRRNDYDVKKAEVSVIMLDEIDKLLYHHDGTSILAQLLRVIEGGEYVLEKSHETEREFHDIHTVKTDHMLFFFAGSFQFRLDEKPRRTGFTVSHETDEENDDYYTIIEKSGLPKELLGRIGDIIILRPLSESMLKSILLESEISPLKTFRGFFEAAGCKLEIDERFIDEVVKEASASPYGARELQRILHRRLMPELFKKTKQHHDAYAEAMEMIGLRAL